LAVRLNELTEYQNPDYLDTLAAAYAERGEFADAIRFQEQALAVGGEENRRAAVARLQQYQKQKPYREAFQAEKSATEPPGSK
jgi:tetratricopeptide (TPR) repeat protein